LSGPTGRRLTSDDIRKAASQPASAKIVYGDGPQQYAELRLPSGIGPFAVVAVIHGGCWVGYSNTDYTAHLASALTAQGWATWNLEYRSANVEGGGWPGTFRDVGMGIDALRDAARSYPLNLDRVVAAGHSAGGQLALWSGGRHRVPRNSDVYLENPLALNGVVSLAGIPDMRAYASFGPKECVAGELKVMGGTPGEHPDRYAAVSPAELLPLGTPQVLVWADEDQVAPESLFLDYERRSDAVVIRVEHAGHHEVCSAEGPGWNNLVAEIRKLLE
jgi:acetyl esterase/lipase